MKVAISRINAIAELQRAGYKFEPAGSEEIKFRCPVHDDANPSCCLNVKSNLWKCHACHASGDIVSLLSHILRVERKTMLVDLSSRYDIGVIKTFSRELVEEYHRKIWDAGPLLQALRDRGVTDEDIRAARLGYDDGRITIPVCNESGYVINVRRYLPGAPGPDKMRNSRGYTSLAIYQPDQIAKYDSLWICGGEIKALVAKRFLNKINIGAIAATGGEGAWSSEFNKSIKDKCIYICMDIDATGYVASRKIAAQIYNSAKSVYIVRLPLSKTKYPKGDINDWVASESANEESFKTATETSILFAIEGEQLDSSPTEIHDAKLHEAALSCNVGKRVRCEASVAALDETAYLIPKTVDVSCSKDQSNCAFCPVFPAKINEETGAAELTVKSHSAGILEMVNCSKKNLQDALKNALGIPSCKAAEFKVKTRYDVMDVRLVPLLQQSGDNSDHVIQSAYIVGGRVELNTPYLFVGCVYPHPTTQQAILLIDSVSSGPDSFNSFEPTDDELRDLRLFQSESNNVECIDNKLSSIYDDIESNVTRIFKRRALHLALDLAFHSCLYFNFDGYTQHGWVNCLILGDSSQGKSEASLRLIDHYGLGTRHDCKNATVAGLLGGLQQLGSKWFVSWGVIPTYDRRLVVLEEVKGANIEVLARLTDMRSSGIAEISKIERRRAHARTRLVYISNPRSNRPVSAYNFGIETIQELMGSPEEVRRFDFSLILTSSQVDPAEINKLSATRTKVAHKYSSELSRQLLLWAWTRTQDQIRLDDDAVIACLEHATSLCNKFSEAMPLCDRGTMRYKLARMAIALACRLFSTDDSNLQIVRVRKCHVDYVASFVDATYSDSTFGYSDFSKAQDFANRVSDEALVRKHIISTKHPLDLVQQMLHTDEITLADIMDWCDLDKDSAQKLLSFLVRKHAIYRQKNFYRKTSDFIKLLKDVRENCPKTAQYSENDEF